MRRIAFILTILGLLSLLLLLNLPSKQINSQNQLNSFHQNQKLLIQGKVIKETYSNNAKILHLNNDLKLECDISCPSFLNKNISATAILESYNNKNYLKILEINENVP